MRLSSEAPSALPNMPRWPWEETAPRTIGLGNQSHPRGLNKIDGAQGCAIGPCHAEHHHHPGASVIMDIEGVLIDFLLDTRATCLVLLSNPNWLKAHKVTMRGVSGKP